MDTLLTPALKRTPALKELLLMEEIRLTTWDAKNPVKNGIFPMNWCRISSINTTIDSMMFTFFATVPVASKNPTPF